MISDQREHACWGSQPHRKAAQSIDHFMAHLVGFEHACCAFEPKDLLNAFPLLDKPTIEIRAAGDVTVLKPPMSFVPGLSLFPTTTIRSAILKEISDILVQCRLILLGSEDIVPSKPMDLCAERTLGMHRIQGEDTPFDQVWGQYWLERTDLILFLLHIAMPQDDASGDLRATELVHRMRLRSGGSQGFAINSRMSVISLPLRRVQSAWFRSTALLGFEAAQKRLPRARPGA